jgi:hypothetical protein
MKTDPATLKRVYAMSLAGVYPHYVATAEKKGRTGMNPSRTLVTGAICGVRVEEIDDPVMQGIRYLDKLIDELAKGRPMEKILRSKDI